VDKIKNNDSYGLKRLESKNAKNAIIQKLSQDFNLTTIIAEAFYQQVSVYFSEHSNISLSSGEVSYEAVCSTEPAGKHIRLTRKVTCRLKLMDINSDFDALANFGLAGMRRLRIERLTRQAYDQGALLTYEDLALLLTTSPATVKRDIFFLRKDGKFIMTRGTKLDMGPGLSHKSIILDFYFKGYSFTDIVRHGGLKPITLKLLLNVILLISFKLLPYTNKTSLSSKFGSSPKNLTALLESTFNFTISTTSLIINACLSLSHLNL